METVSFTRMEDGTAEEYTFLEPLNTKCSNDLADRLMGFLKQMQGDRLGYQIDRYDHSLQSATRAERDGADEETIVCALLHDIGDVISPSNHSQVSAALLRPYISEKNYWIVLNHGLFQGYYWMHHYDENRNLRDKHKNHPYYKDCVDFCSKWDQMSFDPDYETKPLEYFTPMIKEIFSREPRSFV